jgi:hypothetical protein
VCVPCKIIYHWSPVWVFVCPLYCTVIILKSNDLTLAEKWQIIVYIKGKKKKGREEKKRGIQINTTVIDRNNHFRFGFIFIKKIIILKFFKKIKIRSNRPVSVRLGFLEQKPVWLRFFSGFGSFWFFHFLLIKPKPNRTDWFF